MKLALVLFITAASLALPTHEVNSATEEDLLSLQFVYRHGDRTPKSLYKNDPYRQFAWPEGLAALTLKGKERMFQYAKLIRKRYAHYIDNTLARNVVARSSNAKRCLESSLVFLAGLFPPKPSEVWSQTKEDGAFAQTWQPISVDTTDTAHDFMLNPSAECFQATMIELQTFLDPKVQTFLAEHKEFIDQLAHHSGQTFLTPLDAVKLLDTITCEQYYFGDKFQPPKWLDEIGNNTLERMQQLTNDGLKLVYGISNTYLRLRAGTFLRDMLDNLAGAAGDKTIDENSRRVHSYGTHDSVIATIMLALGFFSEPPTFGSGLIVELRRDAQHVPQVHLFYANVTNNMDIYPLKLNESHTFAGRCNLTYCALKEFELSLQEFLPIDLKDECAQKMTNHTSD